MDAHLSVDARPAALGSLAVLSDELIDGILRLLSVPELASFACVSRQVETFSHAITGCFRMLNTDTQDGCGSTA